LVRVLHDNLNCFYVRLKSPFLYHGYSAQEHRTRRQSMIAQQPRRGAQASLMTGSTMLESIIARTLMSEMREQCGPPGLGVTLMLRRFR
jgi:hypothetical protein